MEITSIIFIAIAIICAFIYYLLNNKLRVSFLVLMSCGFIATYSYILLVYVLFYAAFNFFVAKRIRNSTHGKTLYRIGIFVNLTQLIVLRYATFAIDPVIHLFNSDINISGISRIIIPLGISYYTLQGIGYLINVKMKWEEPEENFLSFLLYICFFPKFISGPIERSNHFIPQLKSLNNNYENIINGLKITLFGFFQKVVIANQLAPLITDTYSNMGMYGGIELWTVLLIQPFYLYFDFAGYTNIAIGIAKMFGIELLPNFNRPFLSENVTTFWKRFHMSLSLWFHDYIFRQFSFKYRKLGIWAAVIGVFVTFFLFGIWHGAGWNFMVLGLLIAAAINYEFFTKRQRIKIGSKIPGYLNKMIGRFFNYFFYGICLVFFFAPDLNTSLQFFPLLFKNVSASASIPIDNLTWFALFCGLLLLSLEYLQEDFKNLHGKLDTVFNKNTALRVFVYYTMTLAVLAFIGQKLTFIYQVF
ncbi:MAG TPA: MBOAT family O-acyltransferase [Bacteroidales bacterium]|jgi:D-alanyl-lipoteichoic acid acyltransferase DltB (MBOAT superfamily)|nr:MBOAT family O-acyltransferase [Bacteroidales bacterium]